LCGYEYSGLAKILNIPEHRRFKRPRRPISVLRETEISSLYDGGNNVGMLVMYHAARVAIEKAAARGVSIVGVTNSWMSGRSAYYVEMIAKAELIGIHTASSARSVAPFGGTRPALGTNPIAFGMPSSRGPVVFDMGTSAFMGTDLAYRERLGRLLPEGVALDAEGQPTRDPALARLGALLPFGGYKGFGLAFIVQAFGVLAGSALDPDKDDGYLFVVFKPDLLVNLDDFKHQISELIDRIKATPRQPVVTEIRIPGERAFRSREQALREGIEIDRAVYEALEALRA
jgi:LDH2 family malate/lactate/ureidoglycolate dehydrogenase